MAANAAPAHGQHDAGEQGANTKPAAPAGNPNTGGKTIPKSFTLGKDSLSEYGEVAFDHDSHAFKNYSPDGTAVMGCVECHHTDQPKSALKPPLVTSERDVTMTFDVWQKGNFKVSSCRDCHFQDGNVPEGKEMPRRRIPTPEVGHQDARQPACVSHQLQYVPRRRVQAASGIEKETGICDHKGLHGLSQNELDGPKAV